MFVISVLAFQREPTRQRLTAMLLLGFAFCLLHPVALAYTLLVVALMSVLRYTQFHRLQEPAMTLAVLVVLIIPQGVLRFIANPLTDTVTSVSDAANIDPTLFSRLVLLQKGSFFYGFNPQLLKLDFPWIQSPMLQEAIGWGWLLLAVAITLLAIRQVRESDAARYILGCTALIFIAGVPYLGWLLGYFVSAQLLYRTLWFYPLGLGVAFSVRELARHMAGTSDVASRMNKGFANALVLISLVLVGFAAWTATPAGLTELWQRLGTYRQYIMLGHALDAAVSGEAVVVAPSPVGNFLPGLSWHAKVVSFRNWHQGVYSGLPVEEAKTRAADLARFYAPNASAQERESTLTRYHAAFVVVRTARSEDLWVRGQPELFDRVAAIKGYVLYRFDAGAATQGSYQTVTHSAAWLSALRTESRVIGN
jgi:hypothetical protein